MSDNRTVKVVTKNSNPVVEVVVDDLLVYLVEAGVRSTITERGLLGQLRVVREVGGVNPIESHTDAIDVLITGIDGWDGDLGAEPAPTRAPFSNIPAAPGVGTPIGGGVASAPAGDGLDGAEILEQMLGVKLPGNPKVTLIGPGDQMNLTLGSDGSLTENYIPASGQNED